MKEREAQREVFLVGGMDLEMQTILEVFESEGVAIVDSVAKAVESDAVRVAVNLGLRWGARLSDFGAIPDIEGICWIGLELIEDAPLPVSWRAFDHHGELPVRPCTLEQVVEHLGLSMTSEWERMAVNDSAYIPGLLALGLSDEEVQEIRLNDRLAQGVTKEMEVEAASLVARVLEDQPAPVACRVVATELERFSPIVDRLHGLQRTLLVIGKATWTVFGERGSFLVGAMGSNLQASYQGGGEHGFIGGEIPNVTQRDEVIRKAKQIQHEMNNPVHSRHILMLPVAEDTQQDFPRFDEDPWEAWNELNDGTIHSYNLKHYFLPHCRHVLFGSQVDTEKQFQVWRLKGGAGSFTLKMRDGAEYHMEVQQIEYRRYNMSPDIEEETRAIGLIVLHLVNRKHAGFEQILQLSQIVRRLYPAFYEAGGTSYESRKLLKVSDSTGDNALVPTEFNLKFGKLFSVSYASKGRGEQSRDDLGFLDALAKKIGVDLDPESNPVLDDRMYLISWVGVEKSRLHDWNLVLNQHDETSERTELLSELYRLFYVDGSKGDNCPNSEMKHHLVKQSLYGRWTPYGTFYGVTRYSFIGVTPPEAEAETFVIDHIMTIYRHMAQLALAQRALLLQFSYEINCIQSPSNESKSEKREKVKKLRENYNRFINQVNHREVTAQEQGIELYDMMQDAMNIRSQIGELKDEIEHMDSVEDAKHQENLQRGIDQLTFWSVSLAALGVLAGFLGINVILDDGHGMFGPYLSDEVRIVMVIICSVIAFIWGKLKFLPSKAFAGKPALGFGLIIVFFILVSVLLLF